MGGRMMRMIEIEVFLKAALAGAAVSECFQIFHIIGGNVFRDLLSGWHASSVSVVSWGIVIVVFYLIQRNWIESALRFIAGRRLDVAIAFLAGLCVPIMLGEELASFHEKVEKIGYEWGVFSLLSGLGVLASPMLRSVWVGASGENLSDSVFISDEEISEDRFDFLRNCEQAENFAKVVLEGGARRGMVFGLDGPWGVGKTSFINLAEKTWREQSSKVMVFRFEPTKFLQSSDMLKIFVQELSGALRSKFYAPEFKPLASKYSSLLKAEPSFGIPGLKMALGGIEETVDEMLGDLDEVLARIDLRVIVVIDDLDRLDPATVTSILFLVRRSWSLTRASYVLAYDMEKIVKKADSESARDYIEKFVNAKFSLFVDFEMLSSYLLGGWKSQFESGAHLPSARLLDLSSVLSALADILSSRGAASYAPVLGNMRKLKRFINSLFLVKIEQLNIHENDFSREDIIHLVLLYVNYPGIFRDIYNNEGERRKGLFSVSKPRSDYVNDSGFAEYLKGQCPDECSRFIVRKLFDVDTLALATLGTDKTVLATRACFNSDRRRNLERYLALIVRNLVPELVSTEAIYDSAVSSIKLEGDVRRVLSSGYFDGSALAHEKFWSEFSRRAGSFEETIVVDAINVVVDTLRNYRLDFYGRTGRSAAVYSLAIMVDAIGWTRRGAVEKDRWKIYSRMCDLILGAGHLAEDGIIHRLSAEERGVLGINDMMLFRLQCSGDRGSQLTNIRDALAFGAAQKIINRTKEEAVIEGMRAVSQAAFDVFRKRYIDSSLNFFSLVDGTDDSELKGVFPNHADSESSDTSSIDFQASKASIKRFVPYQLSNRLPPTGSGVGCGYYDESGDGDAGGISIAMTRYLLDTCFRPSVGELSFYFADHCLSSMQNGYSVDGDDLVPTFDGILAGMNEVLVREFWLEFRDQFLEMNLHLVDRQVITINYTAHYREFVQAAWKELDVRFLPEAVVSEYEEG